jgi:hypothetical protein
VKNKQLSPLFNFYYYKVVVLVTLADFGYIVNRSFGFIAPKIFNYFAFQSFAIEHT